MASQPGNVTEEKKRIAFDGESYTRRESLEYFGDKGEARWEEAASIATDCDSPQPSAEPPSNAGAPQLGAALAQTIGARLVSSLCGHRQRGSTLALLSLARPRPLFSNGPKDPRAFLFGDGLSYALSAATCQFGYGRRPRSAKRQRRDCIWSNEGKERKNKPSELRRVEWREEVRVYGVRAPPKTSPEAKITQYRCR